MKKLKKRGFGLEFNSQSEVSLNSELMNHSYPMSTLQSEEFKVLLLEGLAFLNRSSWQCDRRGHCVPPPRGEHPYQHYCEQQLLVLIRGISLPSLQEVDQSCLLLPTKVLEKKWPETKIRTY